MAISYNKLWKLLVDKKMSNADLRKAAGIAPNTMTRLRRDEEVTLEVLNRICVALDVNIGKDYEPLTEEERKYARNPLTHVDFLLFNQMDKQPVLAIEVDGTGFHEAGSKQAERDIKKNSILKKCAISLLRLRTDGSGEREKIRTALKRK